MPSVVLTGGRASRVSAKRRRRAGQIKIPKLPKTKRTRPVVAIKSPATASASERAALQNLAQRLQRGNFSHWLPASGTAAAQAAASTGRTVTATDLSTGSTSTAVPLSGSGRRRRGSSRRVSKKQLKGGFLPALIPIIAAAIGAIPGIAGTAVGIANLQEQKRQFNKMYGNK